MFPFFCLVIVRTAAATDPELQNKVYMLQKALSDGSYYQVLARIAKVGLLAIDDWSVDPLTKQERRGFRIYLKNIFFMNSILL